MSSCACSFPKPWNMLSHELFSSSPACLSSSLDPKSRSNILFLLVSRCGQTAFKVINHRRFSYNKCGEASIVVCMQRRSSPPPHTHTQSLGHTLNTKKQQRSAMHTQAWTRVCSHSRKRAHRISRSMIVTSFTGLSRPLLRSFFSFSRCFSF